MGAFDYLIPQAAPPPVADGGAFDYLIPQQVDGIMRYPALAGSALVKGALASAGAVGDLENWTHRLFTQNIFDPLHRLVTGNSADRALAAAANPANDPLTGKPADDLYGRLAGGGLSSSNLIAGGRALGAVDRPDLAPQTSGEKYLTAGAEGVGGMLPYLWMGGLNPSSALRGAAQGAAAGTAGEAGVQAFPAHADAARAIAGLGGMVLGGKAFDLGDRAVSAIRGATTPAIEAYRNLGIEPTLAGDVTGSPFWQQIQGYGAKSLGGSGRVQAASERAVGQWGNALDDTAAGYGNATTLQEAGTALQQESRDWLQRWRQAQNAAEQAVSARVPAAAPVDLAPVNQVLRSATTSMPGLPEVAGIHTNPVFQRLQTALATDAPGGTATWADVRAWRSRVGEELQQSLLSNDGNQAAWRQLYGSLSRSLGDTAFANNAHAEWQAANDITSQGHQFVENVLGKFINARNPAANTITEEAAAKAAMSGSRQGGSTLQVIRDQMPGAADELAAYKLRDAAAARLQNAAGTGISPRALVSNLSPRALAPEARDALFASDPDLARRVQDLAAVGERMRRTEQFANYSNTGTNLGTAGALTGLLASPFTAIQAYQQGGSRAALAALLGTLGAPYAPGFLAGRASTSPALTRFLAAPTQAPEAAGLVGGAGLYPELRGLLGP